jgi:hypothetical protein
VDKKYGRRILVLFRQKEQVFSFCLDTKRNKKIKAHFLPAAISKARLRPSRPKPLAKYL